MIINGFVSLIGDETGPQPIKGTSEALMLENILLLTRKTEAGTNVLLQGVDPGLHCVSRHHINLESGIVSRQVVVGVIYKIPMEGISLLLGNDLAGDKVLMNPIVSDEPSYKDNELENTEVFSVCAIRKKLEDLI